MILQSRPIDAVSIYIQSEADFARDRRNAGERIIEHLGQYWAEPHRGLYQAAHGLVRMPLAQAVKPALFCWGYSTTLANADARAANATMPYNLLEDISKYDPEDLHLMPRRNLRKSRMLASTVELTGPALLRAEGFEVLRSSTSRTGYSPITYNSSMPSEDAYQKAIEKHFSTRKMILAGIIDGKLGGYLVGYAVGSTAHIDEVTLATDYLPSRIGTSLVFDFVQICRRSNIIREVSYGLFNRGDSALLEFKTRMGFPIVHVPSLVCINPVLAETFRRLMPNGYYRFSGRG